MLLITLFPANFGSDMASSSLWYVKATLTELSDPIFLIAGVLLAITALGLLLNAFRR